MYTNKKGEENGSQKTHRVLETCLIMILIRTLIAIVLRRLELPGLIWFNF